MKRFLAPVLLLAMLGILTPAAAEAGTPPKWSTRVFAMVPSPGFPAYAYAHPNGRVYAGTYTNPLGDAMPSKVFEWSGDGTLLRSWTVPDQSLKTKHGVQVATSDARGRLVLLERSTSSVLTLNVKNGRFKTQAQIPDLPVCSSGKQPCSPNLVDQPAVPGYATWGPDGALFVNDYGQAVIWRIPATGGDAQAWFASEKLDGIEFGTTGLVYQPGSHTMLIAQQTTTGLLSTPRSESSTGWR